MRVLEILLLGTAESRRGADLENLSCPLRVCDGEFDEEKRVRILAYTSLFPNSQKPVQGIFIFQRLANLARRPGNEVRVLAPVPYFPKWLRLTKWQAEGQVLRQETFEDLTVCHPRYPLLPKISMPFQGLLMFLGSYLTARKMKREMQFECIDAHFVYPDGFAAVLLGKLLEVPVVVSARGTDINLYPTFKLIRPLIRWTLRHADGVIAVSVSLQSVMTKLGISADHIRVIGNGIDLSRFHPVDPAEARTRLGLPQIGQAIVSVGGLIPRKGFHLLIPAVAMIAPRFPELQLYILGEGEYRPKLEALARECGVTERVHFRGRVPNELLRFWFSAAEVSCLASSREGWANVLQESLACGTPVVATRVWGAPEIIVSPDLGLLVERDTHAIAATLEQALTKQWDRLAIARHASQRTWQIVANEVEDYLSAILDARASRTRRPSKRGAELDKTSGARSKG
jgi:teichuronic acid biosynthesis glycosyltransferase TuaC